MAYEQSYTFTGAVSAATVLIQPLNVDAPDMTCIGLQCTALGTSGQLAIQVSNDKVAWETVPTQRSNSSAVGSVVYSTGLFYAQVSAKWLRVIMGTAATAGTTTFSLRITATGPTLVAPPSSLPNSTKISTNLSAVNTEGAQLSYYRMLASAASTNATLVKAGAARVASIVGYNTKASALYLKLYNKGSIPVPGTDVPLLTVALAPSSAFNLSCLDFGITFTSGLGYAITGAAADADVTAVAASDVVCMNVMYV